jgi:hypothetical protein
MDYDENQMNQDLTTHENITTIVVIECVGNSRTREKNEEETQRKKTKTRN